jgi:hypothetical protein
MEEGGNHVKITGNLYSSKICFEDFAVNKTSANLVQLHLFGKLLLGLDHLLEIAVTRSNVYYNDDVNFLLKY